MAQLHLHHLENSRSFRILWLLEELGLDYQLTQYQRTQAYLAPKSLEAVHFTGKAPILEVVGINPNQPDKHIALIESAHIIDYLLAKYDSDFVLHPKTDADSQTWRDYDFWMHYSEASAMPPLVMRLVFTKVVERSPALLKPVLKNVCKQVDAALIHKAVKDALAMVEAQLNHYPFFAGNEFSAADIQMAFFIEAVQGRKDMDDIQYHHTVDWLGRCQARPAYQAAVTKGGALQF